MTRSNDLDTLLNNGVQINQSSPWRRRKSEWTFDENKRFENALASFNHDSPDLFEDIGSRIEEKTIQDIKEHYESLVRDVKMIEFGNCDNTFAIPIPIPMDQNTSSSTSKQVAKRKKVNKWSQEEHRKFLIGLEKIGGGDWRGISRFCVQSRTPTQVASHAQKYFLKLKQQHANRRSQNANVVSECNKAEDAAMNTMVLPSGISDPRVVCIADQPFPAPQFS